MDSRWVTTYNDSLGLLLSFLFDCRDYCTETLNRNVLELFQMFKDLLISCLIFANLTRDSLGMIALILISYVFLKQTFCLFIDFGIFDTEMKVAGLMFRQPSAIKEKVHIST